MLRYKTEARPGLVALYDIRPGNGAGQFLEPRSPHEVPSAGFMASVTCGLTAEDQDQLQNPTLPYLTSQMASISTTFSQLVMTNALPSS